MLIGREDEVANLKDVMESDKSEFVAVYGRRRVGKTFLIREVCNYRFAFEHTGLKNALPGGTVLTPKESLRRQLTEFAMSLRKYGMVERRNPKTWYEAFHRLEDVLAFREEERKVVFLDECPWMDTMHSDFLAALDHFWNGWCTMRRDIVLIICGSSASWVLNKIEADVGGLHNRITRHVYLRPFTLHECEMFSNAKGLVMNREQLAEAYMIFGGIPYYWDMLRRDYGLAQNIDRLLFSPNGELSREYEHLYLSLFKNSAPYVAVVRALGTKKCGMTRAEVAEAAGLRENGDLTEVLMVLEQCDFIKAYAPLGKKKRGTVYQLIDNFTLFHFRFLEGGKGLPPDFWSSAESTSAIRTWCGLAFERVVLQHVEQVKRKLGISGVITRTCNWSFVPDGDDGREGTQVDLILDRNDRVINLCEIKYYRRPFTIDDEYDRRLKARRETFIEETGTKSAVHLTLIAANGVVKNANMFDIQSVVTLDDLFYP